jgi:hypothetical protein
VGTVAGSGHLRAAQKTIVEPVFGQIKQAQGFRHFLLRGVDKFRSEWALVCARHNVLKLYRIRTAWIEPFAAPQQHANAHPPARITASCGDITRQIAPQNYASLQQALLRRLLAIPSKINFTQLWHLSKLASKPLTSGCCRDSSCSLYLFSFQLLLSTSGLGKCSAPDLLYFKLAGESGLFAERNETRK